MPPTHANGKICYIEIPATDIARSAGFYGQVFGWHIRQRGDGHTAFDDTTARRPQRRVFSFTLWLTAWPQRLTRLSPAGARSCNRSARMRLRLPRGSATRRET